MREILFRAQVSDWDERWIEGFLVINRGTSMIFCENPVGMFVVDPETVGQYTGLKDKNGKKIFEGDIVSQNWYDYAEPSDDSFGEVVFCEYDCSFSVMDVEKDGIVPLGICHAYHWEAEVIGNVWDHPELLEGETE